MATLSFKNHSHIGNFGLMNTLEVNLKLWLDWCFLKVGAWTDVNASQTDIYSGSYNTLRMIPDDNYTDGQVWGGLRKDWVWESGVNYTDKDSNVCNPIAVSTPTIDGVATTDTYYIDYPNGKIVFTNAVDTDSTVAVNYSYRNIQTYRSDSVPWYRQIQYNSFDSSNLHFTQEDAVGEYSIGGEHRIQLPCIVIDVAARGTARGTELGSGKLTILQDVLLYVLAESKAERNEILDFLRDQVHTTLTLVNVNYINSQSSWPLDYRGMKVNSNTLSTFANDSDYFYRYARIMEGILAETTATDASIYEGLVKYIVQVDNTSSTQGC